MDINNLVFIKEWSSSPVHWQDMGRAQLNKIIRSFNDWQREVGINDSCDIKSARAILVTIREAEQTWASQDGGEEWIVELSKIKLLVHDLLYCFNIEIK